MCSVYAKIVHVLYLRQGVLWCRRILVGYHMQDSTTKRGRHLSPATQAEREMNRKLYSLLLEIKHLNFCSSENGQPIVLLFAHRGVLQGMKGLAVAIEIFLVEVGSEVCTQEYRSGFKPKYGNGELKQLHSSSVLDVTI